MEKEIIELDWFTLAEKIPEIESEMIFILRGRELLANQAIAGVFRGKFFRASATREIYDLGEVLG